MFQFSLLSDLPLLHGITTREGGVSLGAFGSMNTGFGGGDDYDLVCQNVKRVIDQLEMSAKIIIATQQVHGTRVVNIEDSTDFELFTKLNTEGTALEGYSVYRAMDADGLSTQRNDVILMTFYADCVPIVLYDIENKRVATIHSGWKGTVQRFSEQVALSMHKNTYACIGHSAGPCCYEVDEIVFDAFSQRFTSVEMNSIFKAKGQGKYMLDLKLANQLLLIQGGIPVSHIEIDYACTMCHPERYHSHRRAKGGPRGSMSVFVQLL